MYFTVLLTGCIASKISDSQKDVPLVWFVCCLLLRQVTGFCVADKIEIFDLQSSTYSKTEVLMSVYIIKEKKINVNTLNGDEIFLLMLLGKLSSTQKTCHMSNHIFVVSFFTYRCFVTLFSCNT